MRRSIARLRAAYNPAVHQDDSTSPSRLVGLPPVCDEHTRVIVLGSFPGAASLRAQAYYAHPHNLFWRLMGDVLGEADLPAKPYALRLACLLANGIGLWDVFASCERQGSLDSAIRQSVLNDFGRLQRQSPRLILACHNGQASAKQSLQLQAIGLRTQVLPSTSPAYASMRYDEKLARWRAALT